MKCPLCYQASSRLYLKDKYRSYQICSECDLVYVEEQFYLNKEQEKARYDYHQNNPDDPKYKRYFENLISFFKGQLPIAGTGLDLGCGKTMLLSELLSDEGFKTFAYDPYYHPDEKLLEQKYDWIILCEVFEHTQNPLEMVNWIFNHLNSDGLWILAMAFRPSSKELFETWYYKNDPTHYHFWSDKTWDFLTKKFKLSLEKKSHSIFILKKLVTN